MIFLQRYSCVGTAFWLYHLDSNLEKELRSKLYKNYAKEFWNDGTPFHLTQLLHMIQYKYLIMDTVQ